MSFGRIVVCIIHFVFWNRPTFCCQSLAKASDPIEVFSWYGAVSPAQIKVVLHLAGSWCLASWIPVLMLSATAFNSSLRCHVYLLISHSCWAAVNVLRWPFACNWIRFHAWEIPCKSEEVKMHVSSDLYLIGGKLHLKMYLIVHVVGYFGQVNHCLRLHRSC